MARLKRDITYKMKHNTSFRLKSVVQLLLFLLHRTSSYFCHIIPISLPRHGNGLYFHFFLLKEFNLNKTKKFIEIRNT